MTMPRMMVDLDDQLVAEAQRVTGARTKRAAIETALEELVRRRRAAELAKLAGRVPIRLTRRALRAMRAGR
jgi:Arc/MetJ family transcription regulator